MPVTHPLLRPPGAVTNASARRDGFILTGPSPAQIVFHWTQGGTVARATITHPLVIPFHFAPSAPTDAATCTVTHCLGNNPFTPYLPHTHPGRGHQSTKDASDVSDATECRLGPNSIISCPSVTCLDGQHVRPSSWLEGSFTWFLFLSAPLLFPRSRPINASGRPPCYERRSTFTRGTDAS